MATEKIFAESSRCVYRDLAAAVNESEIFYRDTISGEKMDKGIKPRTWLILMMMEMGAERKRFVGTFAGQVGKAGMYGPKYRIKNITTSDGIRLSSVIDCWIYKSVESLDLENGDTISFTAIAKKIVKDKKGDILSPDIFYVLTKPASISKTTRRHK